MLPAYVCEREGGSEGGREMLKVKFKDHMDVCSCVHFTTDERVTLLDIKSEELQPAKSQILPGRETGLGALCHMGAPRR